MFLLIRGASGHPSVTAIFTFHNVSINTEDTGIQIQAFQNLHSTMFLLIPLAAGIRFLCKYHLHSTMFLLILAQH